MLSGRIIDLPSASGAWRFCLHRAASRFPTKRCWIGWHVSAGSLLRTHAGINTKAVAKWRKRQTVEDRKTGPKEPRSTVLSKEEEAVVVAFRRHTLLPFDDCLYALQPTIPHLRARRSTGVSSVTASHVRLKWTVTSRRGSASSATPSVTSNSISPS